MPRLKTIAKVSFGLTRDIGVNDNLVKPNGTQNAKEALNLSNEYYDFDFEDEHDEEPSKVDNTIKSDDSHVQVFQSQTDSMMREKSIEKMKQEIAEIKNEFLETDKLEMINKIHAYPSQQTEKASPSVLESKLAPIEPIKELVIEEEESKIPTPGTPVHHHDEKLKQTTPKPIEVTEEVFELPEARQNFGTHSNVASTEPENTAAPSLIPKEQQSSPLLIKSEKEEAANYGYSLDSKKVDETIGIIDIENICKCLAHAILKHIEFSKGEVLIDDLVSEEEDIPQFSYEFGTELRIDLDEIQRKKEMEAWEAQVRNMGK